MTGSYKKLIAFICVLVFLLEVAVAVMQVILDGNSTQVDGLDLPEGESDVYPDPEFEDLDDNGDGTMSVEEVSYGFVSMYLQRLPFFYDCFRHFLKNFS